MTQLNISLLLLLRRWGAPNPVAILGCTLYLTHIT